MGWLSKTWKQVRSIAAPAIGTAIGGPLGGMIATGLVGRTRPVSFTDAPMTPDYFPAMGSPMPGVGYGGNGRYQQTGAAVGRALPRLANTPTGRAVISGGVGAATGWLFDALGNPIRRRRRRSRGITGVELRNFRRVTKFLTKYTPAVRRMSTAKVMHRKG